MERGKGVGSTLQVERREVVHSPVCPMCPTGGTQHLPSCTVCNYHFNLDIFCRFN